jgi:hypothetical protein
VVSTIAGNEAERLIAVSVKENLVRGFVINGENANDKSGHSVSTAGDVNGDGLDDVIVGAFDANLSSKSRAGKSYVVFGKTDNTASNLSAIAGGSEGFVITTGNAYDYSGNIVSSAGVMRKPPVPLAIAYRLIAVLSVLPKTTYDFPAFDFPLGSDN